MKTVRNSLCRKNLTPNPSSASTCLFGHFTQQPGGCVWYYLLLPTQLPTTLACGLVGRKFPKNNSDSFSSPSGLFLLFLCCNGLSEQAIKFPNQPDLRYLSLLQDTVGDEKQFILSSFYPKHARQLSKFYGFVFVFVFGSK